MPRINEVRLPIDHPADALPDVICTRLGIAPDELLSWSIARRGYDARQKNAIMLVYTIDAEVRETAAIRSGPLIGAIPDTAYRPVAVAPARLRSRPVVIGTGPCGLFAALTLAEMGFRPLILERGKIVRERTRDTWALWRRSVLSPESNVQFGEGGAGTFSDGKLYSGVKDHRHLSRKVLTELVQAGGPEELPYVSKPHIGTFRLVTVVESIRAKILALGGEYRFNARVTDLEVDTRPDGTRRVHGMLLDDGSQIAADHIVLAIGHSARDTFRMLLARGVAIEPKPFSVGVRIEHPQSLIDRARFGASAGNPLLGAADYKLVHHAGNGRSVYSFCMCPGGRVVAATSEPGHVVTNGMSQDSRAEFNANAGIVVGVTPADFPGGLLAGVELQRSLEQRAFAAGGSSYAAPCQLLGDFLAGRASAGLGAVTPSYRPGVAAADLAACLPDYVVAAMREALPAFGARLPGFALHDAVLTGVETRTSSPIRITRDAGGQSLTMRGLFPAGEGAGYAGGILSAAIDGIRIGEAVALNIVGGELPDSLTRGGAAVAYG